MRPITLRDIVRLMIMTDPFTWSIAVDQPIVLLDDNVSRDGGGDHNVSACCLYSTAGEPIHLGLHFCSKSDGEVSLPDTEDARNAH